MQISEYLFDAIFPKFCLSCGKEDNYVCSDCFSKIPIQSKFLCYICGKRSPDGKICFSCKSSKSQYKPNLTGLAIASDWKNLLVRQLVYEYKYRFIRSLSDSIAKIIIKFLHKNKFFDKFISVSRSKAQDSDWIQNIVLIPVPLHKKRLYWRGFNQSELLCDQIEKSFNVSVIKNLLIRQRNTSPQMQIPDKNIRQLNVKDAFKINLTGSSSLRGKNIFIVDDICTTGATLNECAAALMPLRPKSIWGLVVAKH